MQKIQGCGPDPDQRLCGSGSSGREKIKIKIIALCNYFFFFAT
jgi:hypothetical protein